MLRGGLALRDRRDADAISAHGVAVAREHLETRLNALIDGAPAVPAAQRLAAHLAIGSLPSSRFSGSRALTPRTGARSRRFVQRWSPGRSRAGIAPAAGLTRRKCSPVSCRPCVSAGSS